MFQRPTPLLALGLALAAACSRADGRESLGEAQIDTLAGGVIQVTNTGPTAWADTNGWKLVEERVIQPAEGSPGELSHVSGLAADASGNVYVMKPGDTLSAVAASYGVTVDALLAANPGLNPNAIAVGTEIKIP